MRRAVTILVLCFSVALTAAVAISVEPLQISPKKGVVLLRNGQVLSGTIARTGDYYQVDQPHGNLRIKASEVEKVADGVDALYEERRRHIDTGKLKDRLDLAEWCVEQHLLEQAADELAAAISLSPKHPRIALIQRRIELEQSSHSQSAPARQPVDVGPSTEDLDRFMRGLPVRAVETFTSTIQPLLVNSCTTSGCHLSQPSGKLHLLRYPLSRPVSRRVTQRNLYSVWQVIDTAQPAASPLLTEPIGPHGNKEAIFSGRDTVQYRQLKAWVYEVTRQRQPKDVDDDETAKSVGAVRQTGNTQSSPREDADHKDRSPSSDHTASSASARGAKADRDDYVPVDPFDAEVFNRRFLPPQ